MKKQKKKSDIAKRYSGKRLNKSIVNNDVVSIEKIKKNLKKLNGCRST